MLALLLGALAALVIVFAPKKPADEVTVLPGPDGHVGTVVVQRGGERHVLDQAYATSRAGESTVTRLSEQQVRESFGSELRALPSRPAKFLLYFVFGTDELTDESQAELRKVLDELKQRPVPDIAVIGHTDTVGDRRRAQEPPGRDQRALKRPVPAQAHIIQFFLFRRRKRSIGHAVPANAK